MNRTLTLAALSLSAMPALAAAPGGLKDALSGERLGLLPADHFRITTGHCTDCATLKQGLWYFRDQTLAVPRGAQALSSHGATGDIVRSVRDWSAAGEAGKLDYPGLVWLAAPHILDDAAILPEGGLLRSADGVQAGFHLTPKIASNRSFWDGKTTAFFAPASPPARWAGRDSGRTGSSTISTTSTPTVKRGPSPRR